jgi:TolA-binding protein
MTLRANLCRHPGALALVFVATVIIVTRPVAGDDDAALRAYHSANGLLQRGMYELAVAEYRRFLTDHPHHEQGDMARYGLGVCLFRMKQYGEAAHVLEAMADRRALPYCAEANLLLGQCLMAQSRFADAAEVLARVPREQVASELADDAASLQVEALYRAGRFADAAATASTFAERWPDARGRDRVALFSAMASINLHQLDAAVDGLRDVLRRSPDGELSERASFLLAQALHHRGFSEEAIAQYRDVLRKPRSPHAPASMLGLATLLAERTETEEAAKLLDTLLEQYPDHEAARGAAFERGRICLDQKQFEEAQGLFQRAAEAGYAPDQCAYWLAKCDSRREQYSAAARRLGEAITSYPTSPLLADMRYDRAAALMQAGDDAAAHALGEFIDLHPDHPLAAEASYLRAAVLSRAGDLNGARGQCQAFLARHTDHNRAGDVMHLRAELEYSAGDLSAAATAYAQLIERHPDSSHVPGATLRLGACLFRLGRQDEAEHTLKSLNHGDSPPAAARLMLAEIAFGRGDWPAAENHYEAFLNTKPEPQSAAAAMLRLGLARARQEKPREAIEAFDQLLAAHPASEHRVHAMFERGQALLELEEEQAAIDAFDQVLEWPENETLLPHSLQHRANLAMRLGEYRQAAALFERARTLPGLEQALAAEVCFRLGESHFAAGDLAAAAAAFNTFSSRFHGDPRRPEADARRAMALSRMGQHEEALRISEAISGEERARLPAPVHTALGYDLAWSLRAAGRKDEAAALYRTTLNRGLENDLRARMLLELSELELDAGRVEAALALLRDLTGMTGFDRQPAEIQEQARYRAALCQYQLDHHAEAAEAFRAFVEAYPGSQLIAAALLAGGEAAFKAGRYRSAADHLDRLVEEHPGDAERPAALLRLGEALAMLQEWTGSEAAFRRFREDYPDSPHWFQAQFGIAWAQENRGEHETAMASYRTVTERHRGSTAARAQFQIGECLFALRRLDEAARELLKVDILYAYPEWSAAALYEAGRCFEAMTSAGKAAEQFRQVQERFPQSRWAGPAAQRLAALAGAASGGSTAPAGP